MANSEKLIRLLKIISLIEQRDGVSIRTLIEECRVCERTIYRDIEALAMGGMPIYFDTACKKYRFTEKVFLKPLTFSVEEAMMLIQCIQAFTKEKLPISQHLKMAQERILDSMPAERQKKVDQLREAIDISVTSNSAEVCPDVFSCVKQGIHTESRLLIRYYTKTREAMSERKIDPYVITMRGKAWYLIAFCHLRTAIKMFRVDRIKNVSLLPEQFQMPAEFSTESYFERSWLIEQGDPITVRLRFLPDAARWVREEKFHTSQHITEQPDGSLIFEVTVNGSREITRWILGYGASVEVLEPDFLREEVVRIAAGVVRLYRGI